MKRLLQFCLLPLMLLVLTTTSGLAWHSIYVNPSVYHNPRFAACDSSTQNIILTTIDSFFTTKNQSPIVNAYWSPGDFSRYKYPYRDLYRAEVSQRQQDSLHFRPTLLELIPEGKDTYLAKLAYTGQETGGFSSLRFIYNLLITKQGTRYYLSRTTDFYTRNWERYTSGNIRFIVAPDRQYKAKEAAQLDSLSSAYAALLQLPVVPITYYSCTGSEQLFRVKGFDYVPNMYLATSGGQADADAGIIYSAINSEWYPHELAHIYVSKLAGNKGGYAANEGVCTFLGGSLNLSLSDHARILCTFLQQYPGLSPYDLLRNERMVTEVTSSTYTLGGIIAAAAYERDGLQGLQHWLMTGNTAEEIEAFLLAQFQTRSREDIDAWLHARLKHSAGATFPQKK